MADKKISALTGATTPLAGTEVLPVVQGGATVKVAVSDLTAGRAVTAASVNKVAITAPATASTLTIADGKTLAVNDNATLGTGGLTLGNSGGFTAAASKVLTANNSLTLAGTDSTTQTFPTTSATIARTDAAQTFTGDQTFANIAYTNAAARYLCISTILNQGMGVRWGQFPTILAQWTQTVTGTGSFTQTGIGFYMATGANAGSTCAAQIGQLALYKAIGQGSMVWSPTASMRFECTISNITNPSASAISWIMVRSDSMTASNPSDAGQNAIGFRIDEIAIKGLIWDGTTLTATDLSTNLSTGTTQILTFERNASGVTWYVNGVSKGSASANLPTGEKPIVFGASCTNGAAGGGTYFEVLDVKYIAMS